MPVALSLELGRVPPLPSLGDPALVELVLSGSAGEAERSRALHLLGLRLTAPVRVLAVKGTSTGFALPGEPVVHADRLGARIALALVLRRLRDN
ncbi:hypothetical protein [Sphaerisporangium aureirubrum]|uniref:Ferrous iron transport protein A n=1 Tax=Sphaerisporangium aureirubrum TaxID=1544736 RepID=A0ABW1NF58_9ACTN